MRALPILLMLALLAQPAAGLSEDDRNALASALRVLRTGWEEEAGRTATGILEKADPRAPGYASFFESYLSESLLTAELANFLGDRAVRGEALSQRRMLQEALAQVTAREIDGVLRSQLPGRFGPDFYDSPRFVHLHASMRLLGRIAFEGELSRASRSAHYERLRALVAAHPGVLRQQARVDDVAHPGLAVLRAQLYKNLQDLLVPFDPERFIADAGFSGDHAELVRNHRILLLDNNGLDARQRRAIRELLALIPPELHRTPHVMVHELLGKEAKGRPVGPLAGSPGLNIFPISVDSHPGNQFPADVEAASIPGFCAVLQHELNHAVDASVVSSDPSRVRRRDELIARAGSETLRYLRSNIEPGYFVTYPQEFFASIANVYFADSFKTLSLAMKRFENGYTEPIDQFLFFADVYSRGRDTVPFIVQDAECEFSLHPIPIGRDEQGRIDRIELPGSTVRFELDDQGNVVR